MIVCLRFKNGGAPPPPAKHDTPLAGVGFSPSLPSCSAPKSKP